MFRLSLASLIVAMLVALASGPVVASQATPMATPTAIAACPITQPSGSEKDYRLPEPFGPAVYGNHALATNLWMWGEGVVMIPEWALLADGSTEPMKWAWHRRVNGTLTIEGERLDAPPPPLRADIPEGYGSIGFQVSGLVFTGPGCWRITGHLGEESLEFMVWVEYGSDPFKTRNRS